MKIPSDRIFSLMKGSVDYETIEQDWLKAAYQLSLESGIFIEVIVKHDRSNLGNLYLQEIVFKVMEHEFNGLSDLKRAIDNKAFL